MRERTARSVPMSSGAGRASRSSLSAGTPDSLSDNEAASGLGARYKKPNVPRFVINSAILITYVFHVDIIYVSYIYI